MATPSRHRLHPVSPLFAIAAQLRGFIIPALFVIFAARSTSWAPWEMWVMWLAIPFSIAGVVRYFTTRYAFAEDEMIVWSGLFFRNERHVRYARVQNIETVRNPFHRLFAVAEVRIETAGGTEPEARLRVLSLSALEELRRHVFEGKQRAGVEAADDARETAAGAGDTRVLVRLGIRDIVTFGLIDNRGLVVVGAAFGVMWELDFFNVGEVPSASILRSFWSSIAGAGLGFGSWTARQFVLLGGGLVGVLVVVRILSVGWALVRLWGFKLEQHRNELRSSSGLVTRVHGTIPMHRIQMVTVSESPLQRKVGRVSVRVLTAGGTQENPAVTREWLAPILPRSEVDRLLGEVLPAVTLSDAHWQPVHHHARWRLFRQWLWVTLAVAFVAGRIDVATGAVTLTLMTALSWFAARGQARALGYALGDGHLSLRTGWLWKHVSTARYEKIQVTRMRRTPFDRRWRMASLAADTAGGGTHRIDIPYLGEDAAFSLFDRLRDAAMRTRFRW